MTKGGRAYLGIAIVLAVTVLSMVVGDTGAVAIARILGSLAAGLFAAVAVFALVVYWEQRDVPLLLVGVGAAAFVGHDIVVQVVQILFHPVTEGWLRLQGFTTLTGLLVLLGNLMSVVPWQDRRGREPVRPSVVIAASVAGLIALDVLAVVFEPIRFATGSADLGWLGTTAEVTLVVGGGIVLVRSLRWGGRFGWVAAAGAALAILGLAAIGAQKLNGEEVLRLIARATAASTGLTASMLLVFVVIGLQLESTRMRRASDRATEVMEGRAEIASIVAHDVRGPAGTIRSVAGSLRTSYERLGDAERLEFVGMIEQESLRLLRVADQMSLGLKTDAGTLSFTRSDRELEVPILQGLHEAEVGQRDVRLELEPELHAAVDDRWLAEAVRQGIDNAMRFSPAEEPIALRSRREGAQAVIEIEDRGPGIPDDMRERVFEKFCRWRPVSYEDRPGSGLGLFIVRSIAREHGGDAAVVAAPEGGTILQIRLPLEEMN
ncbi:MAG: sensor histidine kinase [Actinomycetota bacterium]